jgi:hypothetical protein
MNHKSLYLAVALGLCVSAVYTVPVAARDAAAKSVQLPDFIYQGRLEENGVLASGTYDLAFSLWDAPSGGTQVGATISEPAFPVTGGLFTINLAFPGAFVGSQMYLEVTIDGVALPRQPVSTAPVAQYALDGNQGPIGPQGLKGEQGDQGDQGIPGIQGLKGDQGDQGLKGDQGDQGDQGIPGIQGLKGDQGDQGLKGDQGDQGIPGIQGLKGDQGDQGIPGIQGLKGDQGDQGLKGDQGDQGIPGIQGLKGDQGDQGIPGIQGLKGDQGPQGIQGPSGAAFVLEFGQQSASIVTNSLSYVTFPQAATASVAVLSGNRVLVTISNVCSADANNSGCLMSYTATGAGVTVPAADANAAGLSSRPGAGTVLATSATYLLQATANGTITVTGHYRLAGNGNATFASSQIILQKID